MNKKYVWALDLSMSCSGLAIFSNDGNLVLIDSIETKSGKSHPEKLKMIADFLLFYKDKYYPEMVVFEKGFYRFAGSTEVVFMVHGVAQYILNEIAQVSYSPATVKKEVGGRGNMKKEELREIIKKNYGNNISFKNLDESDAMAIGLTFFKKGRKQNGE